VTGRRCLGSVVVVCQAQLLEDVGGMGGGAGEDGDGVLVDAVRLAVQRGVEVTTAAPMAVSPIEETVVPRTGPLGPTEMRSDDASALWLKWSMAKSVLSAARTGAAKEVARAAAARVMESFISLVLCVCVCVSGVWPWVSGFECVRLLCLLMTPNCARSSSHSTHERRRNVKGWCAFAQIPQTGAPPSRARQPSSRPREKRGVFCND
jgi:hypothetical protein